MNDEMRKNNGIETLIEYLKQDQHDTYKAQSAAICGMIAENTGLNLSMCQAGIIKILLDGFGHKSL